MFEVLNQSDDELLKGCEVETFRGSGPGGQKADTTESAVRVTHEPTGISVTASERRSQQANRKKALRRLRVQYATRIRHEVDPERIKIPDQLQKYLNGGIQINAKNPHFPFWVKLVLDVLEANEAQLSTTADCFDISTNQLVNFLARDSSVLEEANELRAEHGYGRIKT
jgi:hypothetical protein